MEREGKRKRAVGDDGSRRRTVEEEKATVQLPPPTEEEVEEFFAILRRLHVAVKYFEKSNVGLGGRKLSTEKLETVVLPVVDVEDDAVLEVASGTNVGHVVLDLNKIPEGE